MSTENKTQAHRVYLIKNVKTNQCMFNYTSSQNVGFNPVKFLFGANKKDNAKYVKLAKSIFSHGFAAHKYMMLPEKYTKEQAQQQVYMMQSRFERLSPDLSLNDYTALSPEKEMCDLCGFEYRAALREIHRAKYCKSVIFNDVLKEVGYIDDYKLPEGATEEMLEDWLALDKENRDLDV